MTVLGSDVSDAQADRARSLGVEVVALHDLQSRSDIVTLCCPLNADNRHLFDAEAFARMKSGSYLINTARGPLVDEAAIIEALQSGHLRAPPLTCSGGAAAASSPLRGLDSVILGAHNASNTSDAVLGSTRSRW